MLLRSTLRKVFARRMHRARGRSRQLVSRRCRLDRPISAGIEQLEGRTLLSGTTLTPLAAASIHDEPRDGSGDVFNANAGLLGQDASREDRAVVEFDLTSQPAVNLAVFDFTISASDLSGAPTRIYEVFVYSANGQADLTDFSLGGTSVGTVTLTVSQRSDTYRLDVTAAVQGVISGGSSFVGVRVDPVDDGPASAFTSSTLTINGAPAPSGLRGWETIPNVIRTDGIETFRVEIDVGGHVRSVTLDRFDSRLVAPDPDGDGIVVLRDDGLQGDRVAGDFIYTSGAFRYDTSRTLPSHYLSNSESPAGVYIVTLGRVFIEDLDGTVSDFLVGPEVGLLDKDIPAVPTRVLAPDVVVSEHLINVQTDAYAIQRNLRLLTTDLPRLTQPVYEHLPDAFDLFMFFSTNHLEKLPRFSTDNFASGRHRTAQVNYTGTGPPQFDSSGFFGSDGRLLGLSFLDALDRGMQGSNATHELLHQWSAYISFSLGLSQDFAHYNARSNVGSMLGGFRWIDNGDGTFTIDIDEGAGAGRHAAPLDLYMMGLIDASQVPTLYAYSSSSPLPGTKASNNEPVTQAEIVATVTIDDIIARHGVRTPGPATAQRDFNIGFVAESHNRLLNETEMTFYDIFAAHYTKPIPDGQPDPYVSSGWQSISRYFGHGTTWSSLVPTEPASTLTESGGTTEVSENSAPGLPKPETDTFTVVLTTQPAAGTVVVLDVASANTGEATVSPMQLTFSPSNWDQPQTVTVRGLNDNAPDGDQLVMVTVSVNDGLTTDNAFDPLADQMVSVTVFDVPVTPTMLGPVNGQENVPSQTTFTWQDSAGATTYNVWLIDRADPAVVEYFKFDVPAGGSFQLPAVDALGPGDYRYWFSANNAHGFSTWSGPHDFSVGAAATVPAAPTTGFDTNDSVPRPTITWDAVNGAAFYNVWLINLSDGQPVESRRVGTASFTPSVDLPSSRYRIWVQAGNAAGTSGWSAPFDFDVGAPISVPAPPTGLGVMNADTPRPTIHWDASAGASLYAIWFINRATSAIISSADDLASPNFTPGMDLGNGPYRYWVQAINVAGRSDWSGPFDFSVQVPPQAPLMMSSVGGGSDPSSAQSNSSASASASSIQGTDPVLLEPGTGPVTPTTAVTAEAHQNEQQLVLAAASLGASDVPRLDTGEDVTSESNPGQTPDSQAINPGATILSDEDLEVALVDTVFAADWWLDSIALT